MGRSYLAVVFEALLVVSSWKRVFALSFASIWSDGGGYDMSKLWVGFWDQWALEPGFAMGNCGCGYCQLGNGAVWLRHCGLRAARREYTMFKH